MAQITYKFVHPYMDQSRPHFPALFSETGSRGDRMRATITINRKGKRALWECKSISISLSLFLYVYIFIHNYMYTAHTPHVRMYIKCTQTIINVHCIKVEVRVIPISMYLIVCKTISISLITTVIHVLICITVNTWRGVVHVWVGGGVLLI